jgi:hypothetical protein
MTIAPQPPSAKEALDMTLGLAKLPIEEDEYAQLLRMYPLLKEQAAALRIPEVRYGEPADIYPALQG